MAIKPSPTIAGKLRKLFSNNKQTIEPAIGDSAPGGNVLTLYLGEKTIGRVVNPWLYKNQERTEEYSSYEEATTALKGANVIKVISIGNTVAMPEISSFVTNVVAFTDPVEGSQTVAAVIVDIVSGDTPAFSTCFAWIGSAPNSGTGK